MIVRRGQIWAVALDPVVANEQRGIRPCIVVSADRFNNLPIRQAMVVPLTSRHRGLSHHVAVSDIAVSDGGGLKRSSWAMCEALRTVSLQRFGQLISTAAEDTLAKVTEQLLLWLAPEPPR